MEGAEVEVFKGAMAMISLWRPIIICEIHSQENLEDSRRLLASLGCAIQPVIDAGAFPAHFFAKAHHR